MRNRLRVFLVAGAIGAIVLAVGAAAGSSSSALVVQTAAGQVQGVSTAFDVEWRGIPYAAPPVGALRWRPPAPAAAWSGVRDATQFHAPCSQLDSPTTTTGSEDCLYLNVFTPSGTTASSSLPVMVHLHPGGNFFGAPYEDGGSLVGDGVIVVTVAYRLGVFGFMGLPALTSEGSGQSGEYGALDQVAALQWVHANIAAFGGDPANVTLFGSSAGSFDTAALVASPLTHGLIARASIQGVSFWALNSKWNTIKDVESFGKFVSASTGCSTASDVLACMRSLPADQLVVSAGGGDVSGAPVGSSVLPQTPAQLIAQGSTVPLLVGFDREEDAISYFNDHGGFPTPYTTQNFVSDTDNLLGPRWSAGARQLYPAQAYSSQLWAEIAMRTDAVRGCPTRRLANLAVAHATVYRWLYTHTYENDPGLAQFRASHVLEDPFLWGSDVFGFGYTLSPAEQQLSGEMARYWTNFARTGNPNGAGLPPWPQYDATHERTLTLDDSIGVVSNYHDAQCAYVDTVPVPFPAPWEQISGNDPMKDPPPGFLYGHARAP